MCNYIRMNTNNRLRQSLIHIDSGDRDLIVNTESETFKVKIIPSITNVRFLQLINAELPFTFYPIRTGSNDLIYFKDTGDVARTATIGPGAWSIKDYLVEVKTQMESVGAGTYTVTRNKQTRKITIDADGTFELTTTNTIQANWDIMGFTTTADRTGAATYTGDNAYNMSGDQFIYLQSSMAENLKDSVIVSTGLKNVIAKIPINVAFGSTIFFQPSVAVIFEFKSLIFSDIDFNMRDKNFNILELNNSNWSLTFLVFHEDQLLPPMLPNMTEKEKLKIRELAKQIR